MLSEDGKIWLVTLDWDVRWLDTSPNAGSFPGIDWALQGRTAFVINGRGGELRTIPVSGPDDNVARLDVDFRFDGADLVGQLRVLTSGAVSSRFKALIKRGDTLW